MLQSTLARFVNIYVLLQDAVEMANSEAHAAGAFGSSTARTLKDAALPAPPGSAWRTVLVKVGHVLYCQEKQLWSHISAGSL